MIWLVNAVVVWTFVPYWFQTDLKALGPLGIILGAWSFSIWLRVRKKEKGK